MNTNRETLISVAGADAAGRVKRRGERNGENDQKYELCLNVTAQKEDEEEEEEEEEEEGG